MDLRPRAGRISPAATAVGGGLIVSGLGAYAFLALTARALSPTDYANLSAVWALVFLAGPGLFAPFEQEVARTTARRTAEGQATGPALRSVAIVGACVLTIAALVLAVSWVPITDRLFDGRAAMMTVFAATLPISLALHVGRGSLSGRRRFRSYSTLLAGESVLRVALAAVLLLAGVTGVLPYAITLAVAPLAMVLVAYAWRPVDDPSSPASPAPIREVTANLGFLVMASTLSQALANAAPIVVKLTDDPRVSTRAGDVLAAAVLTRVPLFLFGAVQTAILPGFSAAVGRGDLNRLRSELRGLLVAVAAITFASTVAAYTLGPLGMRLMFGKGFELDRPNLALLAAGAGAFMLSQAVAQALIALDRHALTAGAWLIGLVVFAMTVFAVEGVVTQVVVGFVAGAIAAAAAHVLFVFASAMTSSAVTREEP